MVPAHRVVHFEDVAASISEDTAGVLIEPIQSMGGVIEIPAALDYLNPILSVIPCQLLAYHCARLLNRDVDKPRNLAKSVTVE